MTTTSAWETQVRKAKEQMDAAQTKTDVLTVWVDNLALGHRLLGRILIGQDVEKLIERHEGL